MSTEIKKENKYSIPSEHIFIEVVKSDYEDILNKEIERISKEIKIDGYRKGEAPIELIRVRYHDTIKSEIINNITLNKINELSQINKLIIPPIPQEIKNFNIKADNFSIPILAYYYPEIGFDDIDFNKPINVYKSQEIDDNSVDAYIEMMQTKFGDINTSADNISSSADMIYCQIRNIKNNIIDSEGIDVESIIDISKLDDKIPFIGKKQNDILMIDVKTAFNTKENFIKSVQNESNVEKLKYINITNKLFIKILSVNKLTKSEINEAFYKRLFPFFNIDNIDKLKNIIKNEIIKIREAKFREATIVEFLSSQNFDVDLSEIFDEFIKQLNGEYQSDTLNRFESDINKNIVHNILYSTIKTTIDNVDIEDFIDDRYIGLSDDERNNVVEFYRTNEKNKSKIESMILTNRIFRLITEKSENITEKLIY